MGPNFGTWCTICIVKEWCTSRVKGSIFSFFLIFPNIITYKIAPMSLVWYNTGHILHLVHLAGGFGTFHSMLNSFIHLMMYTYYGLSALGPRFAKFLWWKKYMTSMQIVSIWLITVSLSYNPLPPSLPLWCIHIKVKECYLRFNFHVLDYCQCLRMQDDLPIPECIINKLS